jgi:hypothetical protein
MHPAIRPPVVAFAAAIASFLPAHAQVEDVSEPYYVVVVAEQTPLRCGDRSGFYPVASLRAGQVLLCDGENPEWRRVAYPPNTTVYVNSGLVRFDSARNIAVLSVPSGLKAGNLNTGLRGSWKPVFEPPLQPGVELQVVDFEDHESERFRGYKVLAPEGARAYVEATAVRRATGEEIQAHVDHLTELRAQGIPIPQDGVRRFTPDNLNPIMAPVDKEEPPEHQPDAEPSRADPVIESAPVVEPRQAPRDRQIVAFEQLEAAFQKVRAQPALDAEYDELIAEFNRTLEGIPDTQDNHTLRMSIQQRLEIIKLLRDVQARQRAMEEERRSIDERSKALAAKLAEIDQTRRYIVIGRLTTSTVYDGQNLPLMYRIQSVQDRLPRTLGYLKPDPKLNLDAKVGRVVGVEGRAAVDGALKLNVITPARVDVLTVQEETDGQG